MSITASKLVNLLGRDMDDVDVLSFVASISNDAKWDHEEDASFCSMHPNGLEIKFDEHGKVSSIFLFSQGEDGAQEYGNPLPVELRFSHSRDDVRRELGMPFQSGGGGVFLNEPVAFWDKYRYPTHLLHIQYAPDQKSVKRITLEDLSRSAT